MHFGPSLRARQPLGVVLMAFALAFSAFLGAALGLVWDSAGFGEDEPEEAHVVKEMPDS